MTIKCLVPIVVLLASTFAFAQKGPTLTQTQQPAATFIRSAEIKTAGAQNSADPVADAVLRVISVEGKFNVGVSVVRRSLVKGKTPPDAIIHDAVTEVYQILEGKGVLVTGGTLVGGSALPEAIVRQITGPSTRGTSIVGGTRQDVGPGDIVIIPPNTPHGFVEIKTTRIVYTVVRIDPKRLLELKTQ